MHTIHTAAFFARCSTKIVSINKLVKRVAQLLTCRGGLDDATTINKTVGLRTVVIFLKKGGIMGKHKQFQNVMKNTKRFKQL